MKVGFEWLLGNPSKSFYSAPSGERGGQGEGATIFTKKKCDARSLARCRRCRQITSACLTGAAHGEQPVTIMNGDALGSAEEPMETSPPASPLAIIGNSKCGSQQSQLPPDLGNHLDHDGDPESNSDSSPNENSNDSSIVDLDTSNLSAMPLPNNDNSNSVSVDNHHSNSNESYQDSNDSAQQKMDHVEQSQVNQVTSKPPEIDSVDVDKVVTVNDVVSSNLIKNIIALITNTSKLQLTNFS